MMRRCLLFSLALTLPLQFAGCAGRETAQAPAVPPPLQAAGDARGDPDSPGAAPLTYSVACALADSAPGGDGLAVEDAAQDSGQAVLLKDYEEIASLFAQGSSLCRLAGNAPESLAALERRLRVSLREGRDMLRSRGFYAGELWGVLEEDGARPEHVTVRVLFAPARRYVVGRTSVREDPPLPRHAPADRLAGDGGILPSTLGDVGLPEGAPALAADILAAVNRVAAVYRDRGYPFAKIASARYRPDHERRALTVDIRVDPGAFARMGGSEQQGAPGVSPAYVEAMRTWTVGQAWSASRVESFQEALRRSELFRSVEVGPADREDEPGRRKVVAALDSAPERTVSGSFRYRSDFGPGLQAAWEHRNLTGRGDSLRVEAPLWADMQELVAAYRRPFFSGRGRTLVLRGGALNQDLKAYALRSASVQAGLEQRISPAWSGSLMAGGEGGALKEPGAARREYAMFGLPLSLRRSTVDDALDAGDGSRLTLSLAPYSGEFGGPFTIVRSRLDADAFIPLTEEKRLVLALRGSLGATAGETAGRIPPSTRFYSGGGGSVRGYAYQSIGPRDSDRKPLGGNALLEAGAEARWKLGPQWGLVAFIDGGGVKDHPLKTFAPDMRWGAGLGLRYYTGIGPIRLDLATPLNPREDDAPLHGYISIGQSF
jgi:translocation and assembly module TamA